LHNPHDHPWQRAAAGVLAGALALSGAALAAGTSPASAAPSFTIERVAGLERYATSAALADRFGPSSGAILASGDRGRFADALSANFLAGVRGVPVLLTQHAAVPPVVLAALRRAGVHDITLVGGTDVISLDQERKLRAERFTVTRLGGTNRFETSQKVIAAGRADAAPVGVVATGLDFADALGAGPLSYRGKHPMFLVRRDSVPAETLAAMVAAKTTSVLIVGGEAVVGRGVVSALDAAGITVVERIAGDDRAGTSVALAEHLHEAGYDETAFDLASGQNGGVDALGGAALSGKQGRALLITNTAKNAGSIPRFVESQRASLTGTARVYGGPSAVDDGVLRALEAAAGTGSSKQTFNVTTGGTNAVLQGGTPRHFAVDVGRASSVDIQLFACTSVTADADGVLTFEGTNPGGSGNLAVTQTVKSTVTSVNGTLGASADQAVPRDGVVTFSVTGHPDDTCVVPVVFADPGDIDRLALDAAGRPSNPFGVAGQLTVRAADAPAGQIAASEVTKVDTAHDFFQTGTGTSARAFAYVPSRDVFRLAGAGDTSTVVTAADFEARLSLGDVVSGVYDPTQGSTFTLSDVAPAAPSRVATRVPSGTNAGKAGLEVVFDASSAGSVVSYEVLRATAVTSSVIGQAPTCPDAAAYSAIGSLAAAAGQSAYVFFDATATPPATGESSPQYCYVVRAVDRTGDVSDLSAVAGPATAAAASSTTVTPVNFVADGTAVTGARTIRVRYDQAVNPATIAADGSDFTVTSTSGSVPTDLPVSSAVASGLTTDAVLTLAADLPRGTTLTVTSRTGTDGGTVCAGTGTTDCQVVGQQVFVTPADTAAPLFTGAVASLNGSGADHVLLSYNEAVLAVASGPFDNGQFMYDADCNGGLDSLSGSVARTTDTSLTLTLMNGALPAQDDANDCIQYLDTTTDPDPGDVADGSGNTQLTGTVPVATT